MRVLFLHSNQPDYLADGLFHGLRSVLGLDCVDVPRYDSMYAPLSAGIRSKLRGYGFSLYGLLEDIPALAEARFAWRFDLRSYDLIVVSDIWLQWQLLFELAWLLPAHRLVVLDPGDGPALFPYASLAWRLRRWPQSFLAPVSGVRYFKRELVRGPEAYGPLRFLPHILRRVLPVPRYTLPISFAIPQEKITWVHPRSKTKDFPTHIVDPEVAAEVRGAFFSDVGSDRYIFTSEADYYADLRASRFGITTKRAGWDCLRHYELAANGCVLCFRHLDRKPRDCAPHGLSDTNCITYRNFHELRQVLHHLSTSDYERLHEATYEWISQNTTVQRARLFLEACGSGGAVSRDAGVQGPVRPPAPRLRP